MKLVLCFLFIGTFSMGLLAQKKSSEQLEKNVQQDSIPKEIIPEILDEIILSNNILGSKFEVRNRTGSAYFLSPQGFAAIRLYRYQ